MPLGLLFQRAKQFRDMGISNVRKACRKKHVVYDIKYVFGADQVDGRL